MLNRPNVALRKSFLGELSGSGESDFSILSKTISAMGVEDKPSFASGRVISASVPLLKTSKQDLAKSRVLDVMQSVVSSEKDFLETLKIVCSLVDPKSASRPTGYSKHISDSLSTYIHMSYRWKLIKGATGDLGRFFQSRADLADRLKSVAAKEGLAWADKVIADAKCLTEFFDLLEGFKSHNYLVVFIANLIRPITNRISAKLSKEGDIESWGKLDLAKEFAADKKIRNALMEELYRALCSIHTASIFKCWAIIARYDNELPDSELTGMSITKRGEDEEPPYANFKHLTSSSDLSVVSSPAWGEFGGLLKIAEELSEGDLDNLFTHCVSANGAVWQAYQETLKIRKASESDISSERKERRRLEGEVAHLNSKLKTSETLVAKLQRKAAPEKSAAPAVSQDLRRATQAATSAEDSLAKKEAELARTKQLLNAILSGEGERFILYEKVTLSEVKKKRGIIIGGHNNVISKLRKELPNCIYYSPDSKTVDEDAVRNADYILFFTGYVNHCLTGHALRLARINEIPAGYSDRVNINLILEDVMAIFSGETLEA